ncbi:myeloid cell leukemia protein [Ranavirus maximus]|uniref:Myeloid cell leukemia protein n=1 Tax=Ranavirus maximus TaxID=1887314 RepID=A0A1B2IUH3_FRG3V|nr:putative myeloid cell leukemia protein [Ranavirus maximus]ANZ57225.1 myeloid cell leukemia protein [Ranavirus maximus]
MDVRQFLSDCEAPEEMVALRAAADAVGVDNSACAHLYTMQWEGVNLEEVHASLLGDGVVHWGRVAAFMHICRYTVRTFPSSMDRTEVALTKFIQDPKIYKHLREWTDRLGTDRLGTVGVIGRCLEWLRAGVITGVVLSLLSLLFS